MLNVFTFSNNFFYELVEKIMKRILGQLIHMISRKIKLLRQPSP